MARTYGTTHPKEHCNNGLKSVVTIFIEATPLQELTLVSIPENFPAPYLESQKKKEAKNKHSPLPNKLSTHRPKLQFHRIQSIAF